MSCPPACGWAPPGSAVSTSTGPACVTRCAPHRRRRRRPTGSPSPKSAAKVHPLTVSITAATPSARAAYDLRKLRGKQLVDKPGRTRRYQVIAPILAAVLSPRMGRKPRALDPRRPRLRTNPHRYANTLQRSRHRNPLGATAKAAIGGVCFLSGFSAASRSVTHVRHRKRRSPCGGAKLKVDPICRRQCRCNRCVDGRVRNRYRRRRGRVRRSDIRRCV